MVVIQPQSHSVADRKTHFPQLVERHIDRLERPVDRTVMHLPVFTMHLRHKPQRPPDLRHTHPGCLDTRLLVQSLSIDEAGDEVARLAAEQDMHRYPEQFAEDVPERNIDGRSRCANYPAALHELTAIHQLPDAFNSAGVQSIQKLSKVPDHPDLRELPA